MTHRRPLVRLAISIASGVGAAVLTAIVVAVIDLYLTGHGYGSITREVITGAPAGVHLSVGDVCVLIALIAAAVSTWYRADKTSP